MGAQDDLAGVLHAAAEKHAVPGAVAGVLVGDQRFVAAHGVTSVEYPQDVGRSTLFQVGSITKTFTSAAIMALAQEGRLALDDPVARHLPDLAAATGLDLEAITIERALSHQAGFDGDHLFTEGEGSDLTALAAARRLFTPGTGYSYNNAGFSIAGAVIEAVAGQTFGSFVFDRLLRPLGMDAASFDADRAITHQVAMPHWVADGTAYLIRGAGWQPGWQLEPLDWAAGGLIASVDHLLEWCRFQRDGAAVDGTEILSEASLARLHSPVVNADMCEDIALDWFVRRSDGVTSIGHGGATAGYVSDVVIVPERDVAVVALTNATNGAIVNQIVRRWALEEFAGVRERDPQPDPSASVDASRFEGRFLDSFAVLTVTAGPSPNTLTVTPSERDDVDGWQPPIDPAQTIGFIAEDQGVSRDDPGPQHVVRFGFGREGRADWLLWHGRRALRIEQGEQ